MKTNGVWAVGSKQGIHGSSSIVGGGRGSRSWFTDWDYLSRPLLCFWFVMTAVSCWSNTSTDGRRRRMTWRQIALLSHLITLLLLIIRQHLVFVVHQLGEKRAIVIAQHFVIRAALDRWSVMWHSGFVFQHRLGCLPTIYNFIRP